MSKPFGRSLADFPNLSPAELALIEKARSGVPLLLGNRRPKAPEKKLVVRAGLLRFLALGGDSEAPVHESGLGVAGAWVEGELSLEGLHIPGSLSLVACHFDKALILRGTTFAGSLELDGSFTYGIRGDGLVCHGDLFLRKGFYCLGLVRMLGARVDGDIDFSDAQFEGRSSGALALDLAVVKGSVYFCDGFEAHGSVRMTGARVEHDLICSGAQFLGWEHGHGSPDVALSLQRARIEGALVVSSDTRLSNVSLADAYARLLKDHAHSWVSSITLNGFVYEAISHESPTSAQHRVDWLLKQRPEHVGAGASPDFFHQPWNQLIRTLRVSGHKAEAIEVGEAYETHLRGAGRIGAASSRLPLTIQRIDRWVSRALHLAFGVLAGYGYRPMRLVAWMLAVWLACGYAYWIAALNGVFGPTNPLVFDRQEYGECASNGSAPGRNWYTCAVLKGEYSTFSPLAFSLDVLLPVVNLRQEDSWGPIVSTPKHGVAAELSHFTCAHLIRLLVWFENLFGWASSLLLVATVSGFARRSE